MGNIAHAPGFQEGCTKSLKLNAILVNSTKLIKEKRDATSTTILQHFYNKSWVVSYYWFKFEFSTEITFLTQQ